MTRPINQITTMRLPDGRQVAFVDWSDRPLYSCADILHGATDERIPLFNYVIGDPVTGTQNITVKRTSTDRDTNISTPGAMASTEEMLVYALKPDYTWLATATGTPTDATTATETFALDPIPASWQLAHLFRHTLLELRVSQKTMQQAMLAYFNSGFGVFANSFGAFGAVAATVAAVPGGAGLPSQQSVRSLAIPIHIGGQEKYEVALVNPTGEALNIGLVSHVDAGETAQTNRIAQVRVVMDGLYKRPVS